MKISPNPKTLAAIFAAFFFNSTLSYAWGGYDYDNKVDIDIGPGNLVREGSVIQFYDQKSDEYHTGEILFTDSTAAGFRIQIKDFDTKKERIFIMQKE